MICKQVMQHVIGPSDTLLCQLIFASVNMHYSKWQGFRISVVLCIVAQAVCLTVSPDCAEIIAGDIRPALPFLVLPTSIRLDIL